MEAPEIVLTEAALQHVEKSQFPKGKHFESIPAGGLRVEDISTQSAASFAHPKGRSTRRIHRSSVLFASALALAAWLTIALIWSGLCQPPGNKAGTVSLVQRRLSHSQHGYKLSKAAHGCAVLEENLEILQSALSTTEEPAFKKSRPAPVVFGSTASSTEELPWFPQGSGRGDYLPKQGDGTAFAGTRTSDLIWPRSSEIERQSLSWTGLQAKEHEAGTATRAEAAGAGWWSSLGEWENEAEVDLGVPSLEPLSTQHQQHVQAQKFPRAPLTEFDVALLQPRSAFEETKTTLSSDAPYLNSQIPVGFQTPTVEEAGGASAVAYPASLYLRPVETAMANQPERADCQTPAANEHTVDYRSRKIAEIARMISNAAEEFERGAERAPGQLQPTSWGQMFVQEQPQEEATLEQTLAESLVPSSGAYAEAHPSMFLENENVRATPDLSVPGPPNEKAEQPSLLQSTDNYTLSAQGEQIICRYSGVSSDHSGVAGQATSPSRNLLANVKLDSAGAGDQNQQQDGMPRGSGVAYRENSNASYEATLEKMPKPGNGVQEKGMRDTRSPVGVPILAAPSESARSDNAVNPSAHPYVRLPLVPRESIRRTFDYKTALFCSIHDRSASTALGTMRALFAKKALDWIEVNQLLSACQRLVNYAFFILRWTGSAHCNLQPPCRANRKLGLIFLALDAVVCTIELLGENMQAGLWWKRFISAFNTENHPEAGKKLIPAVTGGGGLCNSLLVAIQHYKTGKRPPVEDVISLKRMLFCSNVSPDIFRKPQWDPWRLDDKGWSEIKSKNFGLVSC